MLLKKLMPVSCGKVLKRCWQDKGGFAIQGIQEGLSLKEKKGRRPKRPTLAQKKKITAAGLKWENWLVSHEDNISLTIISRQSGRRREILT